MQSRFFYILYGIDNGSAIDAGLEESLYQALNDINLENVSANVEQKLIIRNIVVLKKDAKF